MRILYKSSEIRNGIISLFENSKGRRVAISAFVGKGAEDYLPNPKGIELICWPKAGSTNPHTIRKLIQSRVKVFFVDNIHTKLYWTSDIGAIVTSANLSTNALGSGGLIEFGVLMDSSEIDIDQVINKLKLDDVSKNGNLSLHNLDEAHKDFTKHNPRDNTRNNKTQDFNEWIANSPNLREKWKLVILGPGGIELAPSIKSKLKKEYPDRNSYNSWMNAEKGKFFENEWILQLTVSTRKNVSNIDWIYADKVFQVTEKEKREVNDGFDMQVVQIRGYKHYEQPPFSIRSEKIKNAIKRAYSELFKKRSPSGVTPSNNFISKIHKFYQ